MYVCVYVCAYPSAEIPAPAFLRSMVLWCCGGRPPLLAFTFPGAGAVLCGAVCGGWLPLPCLKGGGGGILLWAYGVSYAYTRAYYNSANHAGTRSYEIKNDERARSNE